jgi:hypothetical protein
MANSERLVSDGGISLLGRDLVAHGHRWRDVPDSAHQFFGGRSGLGCECRPEVAQVMHAHIRLARAGEPVFNALGERGLGSLLPRVVVNTNASLTPWVRGGT